LPEGTLLVALAFAATDEVAVRDATGGGAGARAAGRAGAASSAGSAGSEGSAGAPGAKPHIGYQDCSVNGYGSIPIDTFLVGYSHPFTSYFGVH